MPASTLGEPPTPEPPAPPVPDPVVLVTEDELPSDPPIPVVEDPVDPTLVVADEEADVPLPGPASFASDPQNTLPNAIPRTTPSGRNDGSLPFTPTSGVCVHL
jgi:hypothetical protein